MKESNKSLIHTLTYMKNSYMESYHIISKNYLGFNQIVRDLEYMHFNVSSNYINIVKL